MRNFLKCRVNIFTHSLKYFKPTLLCSGQSCSVSKESIDVTVTRGMLWSEKVYLITLAFLHKFVYEFRGNNTYIIQDKTVLVVVHLVF